MAGKEEASVVCFAGVCGLFAPAFKWVVLPRSVPPEAARQDRKRFGDSQQMQCRTWITPAESASPSYPRLPTTQLALPPAPQAAFSSTGSPDPRPPRRPAPRARNDALGGGAALVPCAQALPAGGGLSAEISGRFRAYTTTGGGAL